MNITIKSLGMVVLGISILAGGCYKKNSTNFSGWQSIKNPETVAQLKSFMAEKEAQVKAATNSPSSEFRSFFVVSEMGYWLEVSNAFEGFAETAINAPSPKFKAFFAAVKKGDWLVVSNAFADFRNHTVQYEQLRGTKWEAIFEIWGTFDAFAEGDEKYSTAYANDVINSIPAGSIYFGGTVPGQCLITAMQKSQVNGDPFFTLTQSALPDGTYLEYLHEMYGGKIYTPTGEDSQKSFQDYLEDAKQRLQNHQLKPGEEVRLENGRVQVSGQMARIAIKGLLAKIIFDKNPDHEFYVEESFPLDWMYPHLEPHGLIMKINRQPLSELSDEIVQRDQDYWAKYISPMIGDWLTTNTTVEEVAAFAEKIYVKKDLADFKGDPLFIKTEAAQKMFSKERNSIAGLYEWRTQHTADASEKKRMNDAADFAFRQAWALCPSSPEAVYRYVNFLLEQNPVDDAILVAETTAALPQHKDDTQIIQMVTLLKQKQKEHPPALAN